MTGQSQHVVEVTEANFDQVIYEESVKRPVVIDFWATWCGPCKTLGPILEDLAEEYAGAFLLAKVDVDRNQDIASAVGIQSIPTVLALFGGAPVGQFIGAKPKPEVKQFVDDLLAKAGVPRPPEAPKIPKDPVRAVQYWRAQLESTPDDGEALLALGRLYLGLQQLDEARQTLERVEANTDQYNDAQASLKVMELLAEVGAAGGGEAVRARLEADPGDAGAAYLAACSEAGQGRFVEALETFVELVASGPAEVRADAKRAASTVLQATGRDDPQIEALRRRLARLLF